MPTIGSPAIVVLLAVVNLAVALGAGGRRPAAASRHGRGSGSSPSPSSASLVTRPGAVAQPNEAWIASQGGDALRLDRGRDRLGPGRARSAATPELWVAGTSMTLLTVDAKLMPILPLIARPDSERALVVAFGMGTAFRSALIAGPARPMSWSSSRPSRTCSASTTTTRTRSWPTRTAGSSSPTDATTSSSATSASTSSSPIRRRRSRAPGASVISSKEYYETGRDHLTEGGVMMQWMPYGAPEGEFKEHIRTFASVFPHVTGGPGRGWVRRLHAGFGRADRRSIRRWRARCWPAPASSRTSRPPTTRRRRRSTTGWPSSTARRGCADTAAVDAYVGRGPAHHRRPAAPRVLPHPPPDGRHPGPLIARSYRLLHRQVVRATRFRPSEYPRGDVRPCPRHGARLSGARHELLPDRRRRGPGAARRPASSRAPSVRLHPARRVGRPRRPQPDGDAVLRLGLPSRVVGRVRRQRPRGDPGRRPRRRRRRGPGRGDRRRSCRSCTATRWSRRTR